MTSERDMTSPDIQLSVAREALRRARFAVGAQAEMLAEQMERGTVPCLDGPDALRLFAVILGDETMSNVGTSELVPGLAQLHASSQFHLHSHVSMKS